jgi:photosystem II stability/assembly factor-like uncharacterized protein
MKITLTALIIVFSSLTINAQHMAKPSAREISGLPQWAQLMYSEHPNVFEVDAAYRSFYSSHSFVKSYHTQYYKRWRRSVNNRIDENGFVIEFTVVQLAEMQKEYEKKQDYAKASNWSIVGPLYNTEGSGTQGSGQANIYSVDQCAASPAVMYAGTEPGEVYKSTDEGLNWVQVTKTIDFGSGVTAVEVHPANPNIAFAGGNLGLFRTLDGGITWLNVLPQTNFNVNEILINPGNDQIVLVASDKGLYRSTDGGNTWNQLYTQKTYDVKLNTGNNSIVYMVKNNPGLIICEFFRSTDMGATWSMQSSGWYSSTDPDRNDGGARIAVTAADPNRVYAYLIGEAKANDYGFIGVYRSNDGGTTWTLPNGPTGGPYTSTHPNLAYGYPDWTYHQGFYNCAITASNTDPDMILIGGLNLWRSDDGGSTFSSVAGYVGGPLSMHVDMQDFRNIGNTTWVTTDGGIYRSTDFYTSDPEFRMDGLHGSDYWGFGSGWNEDVLVGGLYHNGNLAHHENYGNGVFLELGGGEAPTGYVNPGNNRKTYFSDIGGKILPLDLNDPIANFSMGMSPNESYWAAESSEIEFHPNCYSIAYLGKDNKLWKTVDGGGSYSLLHTFGTAAQDQIKYIEISSSDPDVIYLNQQPSSGSIGKLWKTINGGITWDQVTIPSGNSRRMLLTIDPTDANRVWIAYPSGANGSKVFQSITGGQSWTNITPTLLNNESVQSILHIAGTGGALYVGTARAVYYRDETGSWAIDNAGLPTYTNVNILKPFYRDGKVRLASYGKGIWESMLNEQPALPIARITVDKLDQTVICASDSFYFEDHSFLNHQNASWSWTFPTGTPSSSSVRNPAVFFEAQGNHLAILTITDGNGNQDTDSLTVSVVNYNAPSIINEGFQGNFLPEGWFLTNPDGNGQWSLNSSVGGYGTSTQCANFDNYNIDSQGTTDDLNVTFNPSTLTDLQLTFDVSYAPYGGQYSDTLHVLVSVDCGANFTQVYSKGGTTLATAPTIGDYFTPTSSQWRTETIQLNNYAGADQLVVAFRNKGHWGNVLYLDNINLASSNSVPEITDDGPVIYPNPIKHGESINVMWDNSNMKVKLLDMNGKEITRKHMVNSGSIQVPAHCSQGVYWLNIETEDEIKNVKITVQ